MRIGVMIFDDGVGGADAVVKKYLENMDCENVVIITCDGNKDFFLELKKYKVISIGTLRDTEIHYRIINKIKYIMGVKSSRRVEKKMRKYAQKIEKIIKEEKLQVVHAHLMQAILCLSYVSLPIKKIATIHDSHGLDGAGFNLFPLEINKFMFSKMDCVTSAVNYFFDLFEKNGIQLNNKVIIPNGVNPNDYKKYTGIIYDKNKFNIVFLGGDLIVKGCDYLAEAINILKNNLCHENICVHVLRDVSTTSHFYEYIQNHNLTEMFDLVGYVSGGKHIQYMKSADLFILPSRTEGAANTLLEAIGLHLCILASNVGGTPELIHDGENGVLCECSAADIAKKIHMLMLDNNLRIKISQKNEEYAKKFSWNGISEKYLEIYQSVLKQM